MKSTELYNLPYYQKMKLSKGLSILFSFCAIIFGIGAVFFLIIVRKDDPVFGLLYGLFMLVLSGFFVYAIMLPKIVRKGFIEITTEYIKISTQFKDYIAYWNEISDINVYKFNSNTMMGILLKKDIAKKTKRTVSNSLNSLYGYPPSSFQVSLSLFKDLDVDKLLLTIQHQVNQTNMNYDNSIDDMINDEVQVENNIFKAITGAFLLSIFLSLIYGYTIYKFETNYIAIPIFASLFIIAVFNKYYMENKFSLGIRLLLGIICLIQPFIAFVEHIMLTAKLEFTINNIMEVTIEYLKYLLDNPFEQIFVLICAIICFGMGVIKGRVGKKVSD
ncbi:hypothetical protein SH2C18_03900 [Clostridium sediminicola]|uniref:STM3941 family protein n=1 Tax=Clostridium sediminicola TaxID=3114879 RepID=UPI0031F22903